MKLKYIPSLLLLIPLLALVFSSCNYLSSTDNTRDIKEGKEIVSSFYADVEAQDINAVNQLSADTLKKVIGANGLGKIVIYVNKKLGNLKSYSVVDGRSSRSEKSDITLYKYKLKAVYDKTSVFEYMGLLKKGQQKPQVISYDVYSDMLR